MSADDTDLEPWRQYWRALYPEYASPESTMHWQAKWKSSEMCTALYGARQRARHEIQASSNGTPHQTVVVTDQVTPVRSITARVCLTCMWVSRDMDAEHDPAD